MCDVLGWYLTWPFQKARTMGKNKAPKRNMEACSHLAANPGASLRTRAPTLKHSADEPSSDYDDVAAPPSDAAWTSRFDGPQAAETAPPRP
ncbi:hypothetical protein GGTG_01418 [Gaeumannomyces tritici R3-111a-1]|uniref:Uncharacterized protein n=1 Tax=Gaeumannomyces tritici (strain R3-111a-1) TaxID=644352 RepID=J3NJI6_GAET3|nr:hypothetical protein GGTG_01418 [Gaeumannomyces tritici R3-111a-1]EJT81438.1 hypothetical protein GGTG_01418 [Gaeumannomyces tritici R3-111a-1]